MVVCHAVNITPALIHVLQVLVGIDLKNTDRRQGGQLSEALFRCFERLVFIINRRQQAVKQINQITEFVVIRLCCTN